eukprot:408164-Pleurochrysis_carterae.AAC.2
MKRSLNEVDWSLTGVKWTQMERSGFRLKWSGLDKAEWSSIGVERSLTGMERHSFGVERNPIGAERSLFREEWSSLRIHRTRSEGSDA